MKIAKHILFYFETNGVYLFDRILLFVFGSMLGNPFASIKKKNVNGLRLKSIFNTYVNVNHTSPG